MRTHTVTATHRTSRTGNVLLWIVQGLLTALFLFAGIVKLTMPVAMLAQTTGLPGVFMRFISVAEILGALGLLLPGVLRIRRGLTPLAAAGLVIIMVGATTLTLAQGQGAMALLPFIVGILAVCVARGRRHWAVGRATSGGRALRPSHAVVA
jgi:DoxX-like family